MDVEIQNMLLLKELGVNISDQGEARDYLKLQKQKGILKKCKKVIQKYGKKISLRKRKKLENVIQEVKRCFGMQED